ncbi:DUF3710 domain-containing protein [Corynebacterium qintianiae]|uniref:DUF3710 domain-containing protein n=1 Tax=Corynebacterium qintianiae TaxID=2709392 RepID=A0A7T0KME7_9CORY|nr:DUF3710 domain-containing protein [Corynebacterium qintianiae]QPK82488.1 DUF3710 domain-containing protein [Corynebacterium qintianiae]
MAMWPFGKKNTKPGEPAAPAEPAGARSAEPSAADSRGEAALRADADATVAVEDADTAVAAATTEISDAPEAGPVSIAHDAVNGSTGPFDGDNVDIDEFDFTDFSNVTLNLGSMKVPLPTDSQVQVEMGEAGPKMVHIVTRHGRATPVAFAAPRTGGMWEESSEEIAEGMRSEGMPVGFETGPWGREIVGTGTNGIIRIIGVEGPRWLYRVTLASPSGKEDEMATLGRELVARSFVYRGNDPILAGNSLPVVLPQQLAQQVQQAVQARAVQQGQAQQPPATGTPTALSEAMKKIMDINKVEGERNNGN